MEEVLKTEMPIAKMESTLVLKAATVSASNCTVSGRPEPKCYVRGCKLAPTEDYEAEVGKLFCLQWRE
nr:hypothetical protein Iba_scaffold24905CG0030 [Ipomoea batatas]